MGPRDHLEHPKGDHMPRLLLTALVLASTPARADNAIDRYVEIIKSAPIRAQVDAKTGFRDLEFGQTCSTTPGFQTAKSLGDLQSYRRPSDKLSIGDGALSSIGYLCSEDKLRLAFVMAPESSVTSIALALVSTYGEPSIKEEGFAYWRGTARTAWMAWGRDDGQLIISMGDLPYADPAALFATLIRAKAQEAASDL